MSIHGQEPSRKNRLFAITDISNSGEIQLLVHKRSTPTSFRIEIVLPIDNILHPPVHKGARSAAGSVSPFPEGGRLLLYDTIAVGTELVQVMLTLHQDAEEGVFHIIGELWGKLVPDRLRACLSIDDIAYEAEVRDGKVMFDSVTFADKVEQISMILMTPDWQDT